MQEFARRPRSSGDAVLLPFCGRCPVVAAVVGIAQGEEEELARELREEAVLKTTGNHAVILSSFETLLDQWKVGV